MGAPETGVLCRSAGPASALERASESGPKIAALTNKASNASAGASSSQASTTARPLAGTLNEPPVSTR